MPLMVTSCCHLHCARKHGKPDWALGFFPRAMQAEFCCQLPAAKIHSDPGSHVNSSTDPLCDLGKVLSSWASCTTPTEELDKILFPAHKVQVTRKAASKKEKKSAHLTPGGDIASKITAGIALPFAEYKWAVLQPAHQWLAY